jgi:hypothetical protein
MLTKLKHLILKFRNSDGKITEADSVNRLPVENSPSQEVDTRTRLDRQNYLLEQILKQLQIITDEDCEL